MIVEPSSEDESLVVADAFGQLTDVENIVGRADELQALHSFLNKAGAAVINVTGARAIGKTELIGAALDRAASLFRDVQRIDLTGATTASALIDVRRHVSRLPVPLHRDDPRWERQRMLLVLDHADALARSGRELVELAAHHGAVVLLLESLPPVRDGGVGVVHVGPLDAAAGEELFRRTADAVAIPLAVDADTTASIRRIWLAVDGNPLAIELAARRLPSVPLHRLARLLEAPHRALDILTTPGGSSEPRAVRTNLADSRSTISADAQRLLELVSVFSGSFTIEAVEAVSAGELASCYDALGELLDERLVELDADTGYARYRLSNLVRGFVTERLTAPGASSAARARRATYYADIARRAAVAFDDANDDAAREILGDDYAEALSAARQLAESDADAALRLAADLGWAANQHGEGGLAELLVELTSSPTAGGEPAARRDALVWLAQLSSWSPVVGDRSAVIAAQLDEAIALAHQLAEPLPLLRALRSQYIANVGMGAMTSAMEACREGVHVATEIGHARWLGRFEVTLGAMFSVLRQYDEGARIAASGLNRALRAGDQQGIAIGALALHAMPAENVPDRAELPPLEAVLHMFRAQGDLANEMHTLASLAQEAIDRRDPRQAATWVLARQERLGRTDLLNGLTVSVMLGIHISRLRGDHAEAALLHGAVAAHAEPLMMIIAPAHAALYRDAIDTVRASLGDPQFDAQVSRGRLLSQEETLGELVKYLRAVADPGPAPAEHRNHAPDQLTAREEQVLRLMGEGLQNKEIAGTLRITPKTVMHHTVAIYRKLGVRGRTEAVTAAARSGILPLT